MKILIVDDIPETREILRKLLSFEADIDVIGTAGTGIEAIEFVAQFKPDIVLMDINMPDMDGIAATEEIKKIHPAIGVVIMSAQSDSGYLRRAMQAGARDFVTKPISGEVLYQTVRRVYETQSEERIRTSLVVSSDSSNSDAKPITDTGGHVIAVYSPQGGAGTTTVATSLAVSLMHEGAQVALIDADLQWGDVGIFLNLNSKYTISNLSDAITELDQALLENIVVSHPSGLKVLLAPHTLEDAERIAAADLAIIIQHMARYYDYLIVDMPKPLGEMALSILDSAERIILVTTPTLPSIKSLRRLLILFLKLNYPPEKVMIVINRLNSSERGRASIPVDAIETNLQRKTDARIPLDERAFLSAVNQGVSIFAHEPNKSPAIELIQLADKVRRSLAGDREVVVALDTPEPRSRMSRMRSGFSG